jgi:hypothetical protein
VRALLAGTLGVLAALLVSCSGSGRGLIPSGNAGPLKSDFEAIARAAQSASGGCGETEAALAHAEQDLAALPASVDRGLRVRLHEGLSHLRAQALTACQQTTQTTTTTPTTTTTSTPTTTTTPSTETTTTQTTPPTTTTTPPTPGGGTPAPGEGEGEAEGEAPAEAAGDNGKHHGKHKEKGEVGQPSHGAAAAAHLAASR